MKVRDLKNRIDLELLTEEKTQDREIEGVYSGDLLSWVMSHAKSNDVWITVRTHINIVAVALMAEISCIIISDGLQAEANTIKKASREGIAILSSKLSAYEICCQMYSAIGKGFS